MKKKRIWLRVAAVILILAVLAVVYEAWRTQNPYTLALKRHVKYDLLHMTTVDTAKETAGLAEGYTVTLYQNGQPISGEGDPAADRKRVYEDGNVTRLVNYLTGYQIDLPAGMEFDFSRSPLYVNGTTEDCMVTISREMVTIQSSVVPLTYRGEREKSNSMPAGRSIW